MLRTATAVMLVGLMLLVSATIALADPPPGNGVSCPTGRCAVGAVDPGSAGSPGSAPSIGIPVSHSETGGSSNTDDSGTSSAGGTAVVVPACTEQPLSPQPAASSPWWDGQTAAEGQVVSWVCADGSTPVVVVPHFTASAAAAAPGAPPAAPAPPPPPDPAVLAQQAYQQIPIPKPDIHFGPHPDLVAVNIPVWLWVSKVQVAPVTVTAGGVSVTATPALTSVSWSMGEPVDPDSPGVLVPAVVCSGDAMYTPAPTDVAPTVVPGCGYSYQWRSLKARTGGLGSWAVSASATWVITWTSNVGQGGTITAPPANSVANLQVGEWQTIGVYAGSESGG
jgi:hypothetical protein